MSIAALAGAYPYEPFTAFDRTLFHKPYTNYQSSSSLIGSESDLDQFLAPKVVSARSAQYSTDPSITTQPGQYSVFTNSYGEVSRGDDTNNYGEVLEPTYREDYAEPILNIHGHGHLSYANEIPDIKVVKDRRIHAAIDGTSPATAATLAYMREVTAEHCGIPAEIFVEAVLAGKSREVATAEAAKAYISALKRGEVFPVGGPCEAAEAAFRQAVVDHKDPILESAIAFINNWPGLVEGNPCALAGVDYVKAIVSGKSNLEAAKLSISAYANSFKQMALEGKPLEDQACMAASRAFWEAIPVSKQPDPARGKAFMAFADKIFHGNALAYDPVCLEGLGGFMESYQAGDDLLTANLKAARAFFVEFQKGELTVPADSACAAAALAYAKEILNKPSAPNAAGMIAYVAEAIKNGERQLDPVCGEATLAYWDAYIASKSEAMANEAAAIGYVEALDKYPNFDQTSSCAKAAEAYIAEFN